MDYTLAVAALLGTWILLRSMGNERERRMRILEVRIRREAEESARSKANADRS
jgi:hypothetical protein